MFIYFFLTGLLYATIAWTVLKYKSISSLPPGPFPLPILGNILDLGKLGHLSILKLTEKYKSGVLRLFLGNRLCLFVSDPKFIHEAFITKSQNFSNRGEFNSTNVFTYAEENAHDISFASGVPWKRHRKVVAAALTKTKVRNLQSYIEYELVEYNKQLENIAKSKEPIDPHFVLKRYSLNIIQRILFGIRFSYDYNNQEEGELSIKLLKLIDDIFDLLGPTDYISDFIPMFAFLDAKQRKRLRAKTEEMHPFIMAHVNQHKEDFDPENPRDLLDLILIESKKPGYDVDFKDRDIFIIAVEMYIAGTDTTATTLEWFMYLLAHNPEWQDKIYAEMINKIGKDNYPTFNDKDNTPILNAVMNESKRMRPVVPLGGLAHISLEDDEVNGVAIPKNTLVFWSTHAYGNRKDVWGDPEKFRPSRFLDPGAEEKDTFAFGPPGPRMCVGSNLALEEMYIAAALLCQRYKWQFATPQSKELDEGVLALVLRPNSYKIILSKR